MPDATPVTEPPPPPPMAEPLNLRVPSSLYNLLVTELGTRSFKSRPPLALIVPLVAMLPSGAILARMMPP